MSVHCRFTQGVFYFGAIESVVGIDVNGPGTDILDKWPWGYMLCPGISISGTMVYSAVVHIPTISRIFCCNILRNSGVGRQLRSRSRNYLRAGALHAPMARERLGSDFYF